MINPKTYSQNDYYEIQKAILYLNQVFSNVQDRDKPELLHSLHTGFRLIDYGYTVEIVIAGFLHDVFEEGDGFENLKKMFGNKVYELVVANTKDKSPKDWSSQYDDLIAKTAAYGEDALIVKAADILDNFVCVFQVDYAPGKEKMIYLVKQIFKYINSNSGIFNELQQTYNYWVNKL